MKALLVYNPQSGRHDRSQDVAQAAARLSAQGWQLELVTTAEMPQLEQAVRRAVEAGVEAVIVAGGDGTVNVAAQPLAHSSTLLGVLPIGTTNVWATEMGIPSDLRDATGVLLGGAVARVDLGQVNGRYFLFVAGVGYDASVTRGVNPKAKRRLGKMAYVLAGAAEAFRLRGVEATVQVHGERLRQRVLMVVASNTRTYGGVLTMAPEACADDGLLDVWVFEGRGRLEALFHILNVLLGRQSRDPGARFYRASRVVIDARSPLPVQVDGDYLGTTPVTIRVATRALRVLIPAGPHPLLRHPPEGAVHAPEPSP